MSANVIGEKKMKSVRGFLQTAFRGDSVKRGIFWVQPDDAIEIVENRNAYNYRTLNRKQVDSLSREIASGEWMEDVSPIVFDTSGNLIDGQHRLRAVYNSGVAVPMTIEANVDPRKASKYDGGLVRTPANAIKRFLPGVKNAAVFASVIKNFWILPNVAGSRPVFRNTELERLYMRAQGSFDMVMEGFCSRHAIIMRMPIVVAFARAHRADPSNRQRLIDGISALYTQDWTGATQMRALSVWLCALHRGHEGVSLRTAGGDLVTNKTLYNKTAYAIDAYLSGRRIKAVRIPNDFVDPFPVDTEEVL